MCWGRFLLPHVLPGLGSPEGRAHLLERFYHIRGGMYVSEQSTSICTLANLLLRSLRDPEVGNLA